MAVAGIDIDKVMLGARRAAEKLNVCDVDKNDAYRYAVIRNILLSKGKSLEIMACYEPAYQYMNAVSYTHLDLYKRQVSARGSAKMSIGTQNDTIPLSLKQP